jgi:GxxExxY protein
MIEPAPELERVMREIVDSAISVHRALGPGLLESVYERCLAYELKIRGLAVAQQVPAPIRYKDLVVEAGLRMDMLVSDGIIVEIKAVERLLPLHEAQLLTYLKVTRKQIGLLINFNTPPLRDGLRRLINSGAFAPSRLISPLNREQLVPRNPAL